MNGLTIEFPSNSAAAYVRMAAEDPQYLTGSQMNTIREYAKRRGFEIIKLYVDNGKGGIHPHDLDSLAELIRDVQTGGFRFSHLLMQDVSRWGRFPDADVSVYYENIFRRAGIVVHYCAEDPEDPGVPVRLIINRLKKSL